MHFIAIEAQQLVVQSAELPECRSGELRIRVAYAGVNRADVFQRKGQYPVPHGDSTILGLEVSGWVDAVSPEAAAAGWVVGDVVCALCPGGGYAESVRVPHAQCFRVPEGYNLAQAACLPEALMTMALSLLHTAHVTAGQCVLIQGGTSGVASVAIPVLNMLGVTVFATVRSAEKAALCESWGAQKAVITDAEDAAETLRQATGGTGMHAVLDMLGGDALNLGLRVLRRGGHLVSIAFLNGAKVSLNVAPILTQNLHWHGVTLRSQSLERKAMLAEMLHARVWPLLAKNPWRPRIDSEFLLFEAAKAHQRMEERLHLGKILLRVGVEHS